MYPLDNVKVVISPSDHVKVVISQGQNFLIYIKLGNMVGKSGKNWENYQQIREKSELLHSQY